VNLHGPVRVADAVSSGTATITLSFDAWKEVRVAATTHSVTVLPPKPAPKTEPVAPNLVATLVHPEKKASTGQLEFSKDGKRLFVSGYPSGVVQIWEVASRKELRRFETPPGTRGTSHYAILAPDWKRLYVPVDERTVQNIELDGKRHRRFDRSGDIRVWDVESGKEGAQLRSTRGASVLYAYSAPGGRFLVAIEADGYDTSHEAPEPRAVVWDLVTGSKRILGEGFYQPSFSPDGKTVAVVREEYVAGKHTNSRVCVLDFTTGKERASLNWPEKERWFSIGPISPDGKVVAVYVGGKMGAPLEIWFRDAKTLADRGRLTGKGDPERAGWGGPGQFTSDSRCFVSTDLEGNVLVWDVRGQKLERSIPLGGGTSCGRFALNPDGNTVAVAWMPKSDTRPGDEPDPQDLPQPRISLIDLAGNAPPRILIAPHGYAGTVAFSPDGKTLAFGSSGAVHLFDLR
jgi:WD40 repeat protein